MIRSPPIAKKDQAARSAGVQVKESNARWTGRTAMTSAAGHRPGRPGRDDPVAVADDTAGDEWKLASAKQPPTANPSRTWSGRPRAVVKCCGHRRTRLAAWVGRLELSCCS
jgi:hypothetical protein